MPLRVLRRLGGALVLLLCLVQADPARAASAPAGWKPFAPDSVWNLPLRADAPLHPDGAAQVGWLRERMAAYGTWINSASCGMPLFWADADTPRVKVTLDPSAYQDKALIRAWSSVPIPPEARPANCADKNFAVLQTQPDGTVTTWEFWLATKKADGTWNARWGGATSDVMADRGAASKLAWADLQAPTIAEQKSGPSWNVTAAGVAMAAGVITIEEMQRGVIDHAVAMALTDTAAGRWLWPAQRSDGADPVPAAIAEGTRLRIDPAVDLDRLTMTPLVRMIARAAQRYGIVVRDRTWSANVFYAEEPQAGQTNPVPGLLGGQYPNNALAAFPWDRLQVLDATTCTVAGPCTVTPKAAIAVDTPAPRVGEPVRLDTTNSVLEHPRTAVEWDFDGDGTFETATGRSVTASWVPAAAGPRPIAVRITTRDGAQVVGTATVDVAPPSAPVVRRPSAVRASAFYAYSSGQSLLTSVSGLTAPPAVPDRYRRLYTSGSSAWAEVDFGGDAVATAGDALVQAYVDCSAAKCARLRVTDAAGTVLGTTDPPFAASGWASVKVPGPFTAEQVAGLKLKVSVRSASTASGGTSVSAASLTAGWR